MIRTLISTTAIATLMMGSAALAEHHSNATIFSVNSGTSTQENTTGYFVAAPGQVLASDLLGKTIYQSTAEDEVAIGDVDDVVMSDDGKALAVIVGVGGFLGIGEKEVAVDFQRLSWVHRDDEKQLVLDASSAELNNAPSFDRTMLHASTQHIEMMAISGSLSAENLIGTRVIGMNDEDLGEIGDVIVATDGSTEAFIVDVGGFLGMGEKPVAMNAKKLNIFKDVDGELHVRVPYTKEQLENQTPYSAEAYRENKDLILHQ